MEVFTWEVDVGSSVEPELRFKEAKFGNGYSQTVGDGLNPVTEAWTISTFGMREKLKPIYDFLKSHGGFKAFQWTTPFGVTMAVRSTDLSMTSDGADVYTLNAKFTQVHVPTA